MKRKVVITDEGRVDELLSRGVAEAIQKAELKEKLMSGKQLRIKLGIDPTSPHIHIGRAVSLLKLRDFQDLGHKIVLIVGDFTGLIGDTSDKDSERPMIAKKIIDQNKKSYFEQVGKIIDIKKAELRYNSEWLAKLKYADIGTHADVFSVADFIARENIAKRLKAGSRVSLREILYPLMQGYDSVAVEADVEIGGIDQKFNLLAGRDLQVKFGQRPQDILMSPIIQGLDGRKMSSSWGNTINLTATPEDMFGKVMSMKDESIIEYFTLCTRVPMSEVQKMTDALKQGENPRDIKMKLATEIVTLYHGAKQASKAQQTFVDTFREGKIPENIPNVSDEDIPNALVTLKLVSSKSEVTRLMKAGGVRNAETGEKMFTFSVSRTKPTVIRIGKRHFIRFVPKKK